jgi:NADH-quinone oxidoreductase subunit A
VQLYEWPVSRIKQPHLQRRPLGTRTHRTPFRGHSHVSIDPLPSITGHSYFAQTGYSPFVATLKTSEWLGSAGLCYDAAFIGLMPRQYIPIMIYAVLAAAFPAVTLMVFKLIRPDSRGEGAKLEPYECGVPAESGSRGRYSVRFYIVAILFVIFDVETIFLFPWAIRYSSLGTYGLFTMLVFLGILIIGYVWLFRKGALDWE